MNSIAFAAWSSFAHAVIMSVLGLEMPAERTGLLIGSAVLVVIGIVLIVLISRQTVTATPSLSGCVTV